MTVYCGMSVPSGISSGMPVARASGSARGEASGGLSLAIGAGLGKFHLFAIVGDPESVSSFGNLINIMNGREF